MLEKLPDLQGLLARSKALSMLDAILSPDEEYRCYRIQHDRISKQCLATMNNGSGDQYSILFCDDSAVIHGFHHESEMSPFNQEPPDTWHGMFDGIPVRLMHALEVTGVDLEATTFCFWKIPDCDQWQRGVKQLPNSEDPDGSQELLRVLLGPAATYREYAQDYFEVTIPIEVIERVYRLEPLTKEEVTSVNPAIDFSVAQTLARAIGYPIMITLHRRRSGDGP